MQVKKGLIKMIGSKGGFVLVFMFLFFGSVCIAAITTSDFVDKFQGWSNSFDDSHYIADVDMTTWTGDGSDEIVISTRVWFNDDPVNGWSHRKDVYFENECGSLTHKAVNTPSGSQSFVGSTCVYLPNTAAASSLDLQPHSSLPKVVFVGDPNLSSLQALNSISLNTTATETTLNSISVYKLEADLDADAYNELLADDTRNIYDGVSYPYSEMYVKASNGEPVRYKMVLEHTVDPNYSVYVQYDWDNIDTTTAIPSGTFDITAEEPECTFREAYSAWLESNCE